MIFDVGEEDFQARVLERSHEVPVVVDFWAEWCGPCRTLGPALEKAVGARDGQLDLAKVDVDGNPDLAASFGIQGIPAVKAFRDGHVVSEFTGAVPPAHIDRFLDGLVPSPADELAHGGDEESLRRALELDPRHSEAAHRLGRLLVARGDYDEARKLLESFEGDFIAAGLAARARLGEEAEREGVPGEALERAFAAWDERDCEAALDALQEALAATDDPELRDLIRRVMVAIFTELGPASEVAREHRRRLAAVLH